MERKITTLVEMLKNNVINNPDKTALVYKDTRLNYAELNDSINRVANGMISMGVRKGDRICLMLQREPQLIISFLASVKIGAIPAPVNYTLPKKQIAEILLFLKPVIIFTREKFLNLIEKIEGATVIVADSSDAEHLSWTDLLKNSAVLPDIDISCEDAAYLNYTSGSTGEQKGAVATHSNIFWNTVSAVETFKITEKDVHLCMFAPFAHPHELFARALYAGGTIVLLDEIFPKSLAKTINDNGVTCMMGLAPMYEMLLDVARGQDLSCLRVPESGGMHTRPDIAARFESTFGVPIYTVWGSTETTGIAIANMADGEKRGFSIGKPCPYYEVRVISEDGFEAKTGEVGEFIFRGPAVVKGYYNMVEETNRCFSDGWYYSGDLGMKDDEGFLFFVNRKNEMIKVAGLKVYPSEIEKVLISHPKIKEAVVIGSPDGLKGEIPRAVIVLKFGQDITKEEVHHFCKKSLPNYKVPRIIEFKEELPKMSSGKIDKKAVLIGMAEAGLVS